MKQETKELIDWIKKQINIAKTNNIDPVWNGKHEAYNADYQKAMAFLDSLPGIEARFTRGGIFKTRTELLAVMMIKLNLKQYYQEQNIIREICYGRLMSVDF